MIPSKPPFAASLLSVLLFTLSGCGGAGDLPELGLVSGTVKLDGQPLAGVEVAFHPTEGRPAIGTTDAQGKYSLSYKPGMPGCTVGNNHVTIGTAEGADDEAEGDELVQTPGEARPVVPAQYNENSDLQRDVKPGENTFDFDLTSKRSSEE